jgi:Histidine kinase-, DNA gyrase B-, and HSP90-like ATPase
LKQVLMKLKRNAVEAMATSERRELAITTSRVEEMIEIAFADTGPGLPEQVRLRLFEPFVTTGPNGMGMGLSICRTIIEAHGGELSGEDGDDGATVFRLTIPSPAALSGHDPHRRGSPLWTRITESARDSPRAHNTTIEVPDETDNHRNRVDLPFFRPGGACQ